MHVLPVAQMGGCMWIFQIFQIFQLLHSGQSELQLWSQQTMTLTTQTQYA